MLTELDDQIDAVVISTPDHMHYAPALMAITMGKHVYVEKPLTHTVWEARQLTLAARKHGVATQMGITNHSRKGIRLLCEWVWADAIGPVREVHVWTDRPVGRWTQGMMERPREKPPVPETLDWNLWVGTAPWRPYHPDYLPFIWRGWWDFGTGALGDMACHIFDAAFWSLRLDEPIKSGQPLVVEATSSPVSDEAAPEWSIVTYKIPARGEMPPVTLKWYEGGKMPPRPEELEPDRKLPGGTGGQLFVGDKGKIMTTAYCESPRIIPEAKMREFLPNRPPQTIPRSPGHAEEWISACKGGEPALSNFDYSGPLTELVLLGNLAIRSGKRLEYDGRKMRVLNVPEANQFLRHKFRKF